MNVPRFVKADVMREEGSPDFMPHLPRYVRASDYDALAAELAEAKRNVDYCRLWHTADTEQQMILRRSESETEGERS